MSPFRNAELTQRYDSFWQTAVQEWLHEGVQTDPYLHQRSADQRRGLTLIARPAPAVSERIVQFLQRIAAVAPLQYFYPRASFHLTMLSLFTATEQFAPYYERLEAYRSAVEQALADVGSFTITFQGITASPSAVMIQGFPEANALDEVRDAVRNALRRMGLGESLDRRYLITTAHMTVLRFQHQPRDIQAMVDVLAAYRYEDFGETSIDTLELVKNDWYMSPDRVDIVATYDLRAKA